MLSKPSLLLRAVAGMALVLGAPPVGAQHPLPPRAAPLFERARLSDVIVLGRILDVAPGRTNVQRIDALRGDPPETFQVKRSPQRADPYETNDLAVLFLRGARSPYVHVDETGQWVHLDDADATRRLATDLRKLLEAGDDPGRLLEIHQRWLASPDERLRTLAVRTFLEEDPPFGPVPAELVHELVRRAMDPERSSGERQAAVIVAVTHEAGLQELVARAPGPAQTADPEIASHVLHVAAGRRTPGTAEALRRALDHPDPAIRRVGLQVMALRGSFEIPRDTVAQIAEKDPDTDTRRRAESTLRALDR